jgi:hypothetical protein
VLERLAIVGRVRLEVKGENILLQPVDGHRRATPPEQASPDEDLFIEEDPLPEVQAPKIVQRLMGLLKRRAYEPIVRVEEVSRVYAVDGPHRSGFERRPIWK